MQNSLYAITEQKKADLDRLTAKVNDSQFKVNELQTVVTSLQQKSDEFSGYLSEAEAERTSALNNANMVDSVVKSVKELVRNVSIVKGQASKTNDQIQLTSKSLAKLIEQLIFSVEIINKLSKLVNKKKALNPLISDELIKNITLATTDANEAIASTLTAIKSCYVTVASAEESTTVTALEDDQSVALYELLTGENASVSKQVTYAKQAYQHIQTVESRITDVKNAESNVLQALCGPVPAEAEPAELPPLEEKINQYVAAINQLEGEYKSAKAQVTSSQELVEEFQANKVTGLETLANNEEAVSSLEVNVSDLEAKVKVSEGHNKAIVKKALDEAKKLLSAAKTKLTKSQDALTELNSTLLTHRTQLSSSQEKQEAAKVAFEKNQSDLADAQEQLSKSVTTSLNRPQPLLPVREAQALLAAASQAVDTAREDLNSTEEELQQVNLKKQLLSASDNSVNIDQQISILEQHAQLNRRSLTSKQTAELQAQEQLNAANRLFRVTETKLERATSRLNTAIDQLNQTTDNQQPNAICILLQKAYADSVENYQNRLKANTAVTKELEKAQSNLTNAQIKLNSTKLGLEAATAAALAA